MGPIPWMLMGELFTVELLGAASSIAVLANWFFAFVVTLSYQPLVDYLNIANVFWLFAALMVAATCFTFLVVPETKGKSVQTIQQELEGRRKSVGSF